MKLQTIATFFILVATLLISACQPETFVEITGGFQVEITDKTQKVPLTVNIINNINGAENFEWTFEEAQPATSNLKNPKGIIFSKVGSYKIKLVATNADGQRIQQEQTIVVANRLAPQFSFAVIGEEQSPVKVKFQTASTDKPTWTFEGGSPATSTEQNPEVVFENGGNHKVSLKLTNDFTTAQKDSVIQLAPELEAAFNWEVAPQDLELEVPIEVSFKSKSTAVKTLQWQIEGPDNSTESNSTWKKTFVKAGKYTVQLEVSNGKKTKTIKQVLDLKPDKGFYDIKDLQLGIFNNTKIGNHFSINLRQVFTEKQVEQQQLSSQIDWVYLGLDAQFSYNRFLSPNTAKEAGFNALTNGKKTIISNNQRFYSVQDFMTADLSLLKSLDLNKAVEVTKFFESTNQHLVPFETQTGKKGLILVRKAVVDGQNSYLVVDVKVMK